MPTRHKNGNASFAVADIFTCRCTRGLFFFSASCFADMQVEMYNLRSTNGI